jgi:ubiquinone/menaquinone biosynthesis C-methylase UbiE
MESQNDQKIIQKYYDDLYCQKQEKIMRPIGAFRIFLDHLDVKPGGKLLDIACGAGSLLKNAHDSQLTTYGLDISIEALKIARKTSPSSKLFLGLGEQLPFPNDYFDYITCLGSLEHFADIDSGLKEMVRVSTKYAKFCIMVPNVNYKFGAGTDQIEEKLLTLEQWKSILKKNGLKIIKIKQDKYFSNVLSPKKILAQKGLKGKLRMFKRKMLWIFMPLSETYQFIFICNTID